MEPALVNALLAGQDVIFLGERGQAKSRMIRQLAGLLDEEIPVLAEVEIHEDPLSPISVEGRERLETLGDAAPIRWVGREERYAEKLATPDITIADLIGEVDPIKVAEGAVSVGRVDAAFWSGAADESGDFLHQ